MIKDYQKLLNLIRAILDMVVTAVSYILAFTFQFGILGKPIVPLSTAQYMLPLLGIIPVYMLLYAVFQLYRPQRVMGRRLEAGRVAGANAIGVMLIVLVLFLGHVQHFSRNMLFFFAVINTVLMIAFKLFVRMIMSNLRRRGFNQKHILLVGYSRCSEMFIDRVRQNPEWGYNVRGILDDTKERGEEYRGVKVIGEIQNLEDILAQNRLDEVVITLGIEEMSKLRLVVAQCEKSGVHTKMIPDYNDIIPSRPYTEDLLGLPIVHIRRVPLNNPINAFIKRSIDFILTLMGVIAISPILAACAIAVRMSGEGPILYCQERVGLHNKPFKMYKFRSMIVQDPNKEKNAWTTKNDPRVTKVGAFLRRTNLDELPQLFNVLKGDMSLIGPRPERPHFVEKFKEEIPRYMVKHQVRPGMTGWAQVNGLRGDTSIRKRIDCDLYYIENWTLGLDIKIFLMTFFGRKVNKNAY